MSSSQPQYIEDQDFMPDNFPNNLTKKSYKKNHQHRHSQQQQQQYQRSNNSQNQNQDQSSENHSNQSQSIQLTQQQKLQNQIMQQITQNQQSTPYQNELTIDLLEKLKDFQYAAQNKNNDDLITIRIQQLVLNKLLVFTYNKSQYRLVLSHYHLGQAYLKNDCIEQAIEHISIALHKIQKLFDLIPDTRLLQTFMQNQLAASLIKKQNYDDAIELLNNSIMQENNYRDFVRQSAKTVREQKNTKSLILLSLCHSKINQYDAALKVIDEVISVTKKKKMAKTEYAFALVEKAKILALQKNFTQAIAFQEQAIDILMQENYSKPEEVAEMYTTLSGYHEELGNIQNSLTCIQKVKTLYQELYSAEDKKVIKARRKIATYLLKSERFKQAVNELLQVVELEQKVFGDNSLQIARTLKLLGAVYISMQVADARAYLKRAMNIFSSHGNKKQVQEIKIKLKMLMTGDGQNNNIDTKILSEHDI